MTAMATTILKPKRERRTSDPKRVNQTCIEVVLPGSGQRVLDSEKHSPTNQIQRAKSGQRILDSENHSPTGGKIWEEKSGGQNPGKGFWTRKTTHPRESTSGAAKSGGAKSGQRIRNSENHSPSSPSFGRCWFLENQNQKNTGPKGGKHNKEGGGQAAPPCRWEVKRQPHPKGGKRGSTKQRETAPPERTSRRPDHPAGTSLRKNRITEKAPLANETKRQSWNLAQWCHFVRGNDQCKLPCLDCWIGALFVWRTFSVIFVCKLQHKLQDTTRMSMTVVVQEDLCVYAGSAWALQVRSLYKGVRRVKMNTRENEVETTCLATARWWRLVSNKTIRWWKQRIKCG